MDMTFRIAHLRNIIRFPVRRKEFRSGQMINSRVLYVRYLRTTGRPAAGVIETSR